jgi:hypothetical protein
MEKKERKGIRCGWRTGAACRQDSSMYGFYVIFKSCSHGILSIPACHTIGACRKGGGLFVYPGRFSNLHEQGGPATVSMLSH